MGEIVIFHHRKSEWQIENTLLVLDTENRREPPTNPTFQLQDKMHLGHLRLFLLVESTDIRRRCI